MTQDRKDNFLNIALWSLNSYVLPGFVEYVLVVGVGQSAVKNYYIGMTSSDVIFQETSDEDRTLQEEWLVESMWKFSELLLFMEMSNM